MRDFRFFKITIFTVLLCLCTSSALFAEPKLFTQKLSYLRFIEYKILKSENNILEVEIANRNRDMNYTGGQMPEDVMLFAAPGQKAPVITWTNYAFSLFDNETFVRDITLNNPDPLIPIDTPETFFSFKYEGQFRNFDLISLKYKFKKSVSDKTRIYNMVLKTATIKIEFKENLPTLSDEEKKTFIDSYSKRILGALCVNGNFIDSFVKKSGSEPDSFKSIKNWQTFLLDNSTTGTILKMKIFTSGVHKIDYNTIQKAGIVPENITTKALRLYVEGKELPIFFKNDNSSVFLPNDAIFFFIKDWDVWANPYMTAWLLEDKKSANNIQIRKMEPASLKDTEYPKFIAGITEIVEKPMVGYNHRIPQPAFNGKWYWQKIQSGEFNPVKFALDGYNPDTKTQCGLELYFSNTSRSADGIVEIFLNEKFLERIQWKGIANKTITKNLPANLFKPGENTLSLYSPQEDSQTPISSEVYFIGYKLKYERELKSAAGVIDAVIPVTSDNKGVWTYFIPGQSSTKLFGINVTDTDNPAALYITNFEETQTSTAGVKVYDKFAQTNKQGGRNTHCIFFTEDSAKTPWVVEKYKVNSTKDILSVNNQYDTVIISHPKFVEETKRYANYLNSKEIKTIIVNIEDIFDQFNYGEKKDQSIKDFLKYAYYKWKKPAVTSAILVGEASDIPSLYNCYGENIQEDFVPTYGFNNMSAPMKSDSMYAYLSGDDSIPDISIGRFPVNTVEELKIIIDKNINYEMNPPTGAWHIQHAFITDDEEEFNPIADTYIDCGLPTFAKYEKIYARDFPYERFFRIIVRKRSVECTEKIMESLNRGLLTCNYVGHGGPNIWSSERLFHILDIPLLKNKDKLPFITSSSCDTGWLDYPEMPVKASMGELFLKSEHGGIACFFPTSGASPSEHQYLMTFIHQALNLKNLPSFGEASVYSKILFNAHRYNPSLIDQYVLIGSPNTTLSFVDKIIPINVDPVQVDMSKNPKIKISGDAGPDFWAAGEVFITDLDKNQISLSKSLRLFDGKFSGELDIPENTKPGYYDLVFFAENAEAKKEAIGSKTIYIDTPDLDVKFETVNYKPSYTEGEKVPLRISIENLSYLKLDNVEIEMRDMKVNPPQVLMNQKIPINPKSKKILSLDWSAVGGVHKLNFHARVINGEKNTEWKEKDILFCVTPKNNILAFDILPEEIKTEPDPLVSNAKPIFKIPFFNTGSQTVNNFEVAFFLGEGSKIGDSIKIENFAPGTQRFLSFNSPKEFPAGNFRSIIKITDTTTSTSQEIPYVIQVKKRTDLMVIPESIKAESDHFYPGETIFIKAKVKNIGDVPAKNVYFDAFENAPWVEANICHPEYSSVTNIVKEILPGEEKELTVRWDRDESPFDTTAFFAINSKKSIPEDNYENNTAAVKIKLSVYSNLKITAELLSQKNNNITRGSILKFKYTLTAEGKTTFRDVPLDITLESPFDKKKPLCKTVEIPEMRPGDVYSKEIEWEVSDFYNKIVFEVNREKYVAENTFIDNAVIMDFNFVCPPAYFVKTDQNLLDTRYMFNLGKKEFTQMNPSYQITPFHKKFENKTNFSMDKKYLKESVAEDSAGEDPMKNNKWTFENGRIEASPYENPMPVSFSFPVPDKSLLYYDVFLYAENNDAYRDGIRASKFLINVENSSEFKLMDCTKQESFYTSKEYYLGRFDVKDGYLDLTIKTTGEEYWTVIHSIVLAPALAYYESPVISLTGKKIFENYLYGEFDESVPLNNSIIYNIRFGSYSIDRNVKWTEWAEIAGQEKGDDGKFRFTAPVNGELFQWKAKMIKDNSDKYPVLSGFKYKLTNKSEAN